MIQKEKSFLSCAMTSTLTTFAVTRIRTWVVAATTRSTNHYTITAITAELIIISLDIKVIGHRHAKTCLMPYANNKGADQPAHPRSLISTFVVRCLDSKMPLVSISEISRLWLVAVAEQTGLSHTWSKMFEMFA